MIPLVLILLLILFLFAKYVLKGGSLNKTKELVSSLSLFALVWGVLGQVVGLISGFEFMEAEGAISPSILAGGLKVSFITVAFGLIIYLIARLGIIFLTWKTKD